MTDKTSTYTHKAHGHPIQLVGEPRDVVMPSPKETSPHAGDTTELQQMMKDAEELSLPTLREMALNSSARAVGMALHAFMAKWCECHPDATQEETEAEVCTLAEEWGARA